MRVKRKILCLLVSLLLLSGCDFLFENFKDVQAREALEDLMAIQERFYQENNRYARNLTEIDKYNLKYHTGIVYLEIESAGKDAYRAIALPAESGTARVFAYDTAQGGYYEMGEEEVSTYVLGALNHIRKIQAEKRLTDYVSIFLMLMLVSAGGLFYRRNPVPAPGWVFLPWFLNLPPLALSVSILNYMDGETVFSEKLQIAILAALVLTAVNLVIHFMSLSKIPAGEQKTNLTTLVACGILIAVCNATILTHTFAKYYGTKPAPPVFIVPGQ